MNKFQAEITYIDACLNDAPKVNDAKAVEKWLFTQQNCVAAYVKWMLKKKGKTIRNILTETAGRTWHRVNDPNGKAQRLWKHLGQELETLLQNNGKNLDKKHKKVMVRVLTKIFESKYTYRKITEKCSERCKQPLAIKADLIFPYHSELLPLLLPMETYIWRWVVKAPDNNAVGIPPIGDFVAGLTINRLGMMTHVLDRLTLLANINSQRTDSLIVSGDLSYDLSKRLNAVRDEIWDTRADATERAGAMALLQTYLATESYRNEFEADWTVIPWPDKSKETAGMITDNLEYLKKIDTLQTKAVLWSSRGEALRETIDRAMKDHPEETIEIVKGGLEWLKGELEGKAFISKTAIKSSGADTKEYDLFISHATEDKDEIAKLLAHKLRDLGLKVWYDKFELKIGDSLRQSIDKGLSSSRHGVVILSHAFFTKEWPQRELDGLMAKEKSSILPIWHKISYDEVKGYSPMMAERFAMKTELGIDQIAEEIFKKIACKS